MDWIDVWPIAVSVLAAASTAGMLLSTVSALKKRVDDAEKRLRDAEQQIARNTGTVEAQSATINRFEGRFESLERKNHS